MKLAKLKAANPYPTSPVFVSLYCKYYNVRLCFLGPILSLLPQHFKPKGHSLSPRRASRRNPHPNFHNCMQNDVTKARHSLASSCKKLSVCYFNFRSNLSDVIYEWFVGHRRSSKFTRSVSSLRSWSIRSSSSSSWEMLIRTLGLVSDLRDLERNKPGHGLKLIAMFRYY